MSLSEKNSFNSSGMSLSRSRRLYLAVMLGMMAAFGPLCTDTYLPMLPSLSADLSISTTMTQLTITACLLGMALGQLFVGPISDGKGRRWPLFISLVLFSVASILCALADSGNVFILLRFAQGLGGAGGIVLSRAIACDLFRGAELTSFMSLLMAIQGIAPIIGPLLGGGIAIIGGWPLIFVFLTGFGVILFFMTIRGLPETLSEKTRRSDGIIASFRSMGALFHEKAFLCSIMAAALITGRLSRKLGDARLLKLGDTLRCTACVGVLAVTLMAPTSPWPLLLALFFMQALQGVTLTASFTLAISAQKVGAGAASGILGVAMFVFGAFASPLVGLAGPNTALPLGIVSALTGIVSLILTLCGNKFMEAPTS